jgi:hypothetical protein
MYLPVVAPGSGTTSPEITAFRHKRTDRTTRRDEVGRCQDGGRARARGESRSRAGASIQRPPKVQPAEHIIHKTSVFVYTGKLPVSPGTYPHSWLLYMASALDSTTEWSPSPLATTDFITTIIDDSNSMALTEYLRPVNWILSSGSGKDSNVIVISPYEANALLPIIRKSKKVRLHVYAPRVMLSMRSFSDLTFYTIPDSPAEPWSAPAHVRMELNLFAGQLYFDSREEYERVCGMLALSMAHPGAEHCEDRWVCTPMYRTGGSSPFEKAKYLY